ncbi:MULTISPECIES: cytochrome C5 [unclassified Lactobacillus]|uniref:cytochrome C5 n=1 Tax=unclassified Lactobacillus TaxID=2620435 RepID=UPI000EFBB013|nr:cytochrome C5 [Lactobacillus sp. ESL0237]RMC43016.1 cytochrome C5 [Lactobacillus sp. ESL0234]RMC43870.1 cytochrome C5 [Lactobacillus sp. ESL0236]RMC44871.1 cytochrome C5 [Lactobacillus sp. ESL0230]
MGKQSHITRNEYRKKYMTNNEKAGSSSPTVRTSQTEKARTNYRHLKLNFWEIFSDRPYLAVTVIVLAIFFIMAKLWLLLVLLLLLVIVGVLVIARSHHPNQVLSLEFKLKAQRKLSMLRSLQFGGSIIMFLATYMKKVVTVNFSTAGSTDGLQVIQGILSNRAGIYGQQGSYFLSLLNTLTGGQLWGKYRYATNSAQMMNSNAGRLIIIWVLLLMLAPAFCVLAQFFREPHARNATLVASLIATVDLLLTPYLMRKWIVAYAMENRLAHEQAMAAISIGPMAYIAMLCSILVLMISIYRIIKQDKFD